MHFRQDLRTAVVLAYRSAVVRSSSLKERAGSVELYGLIRAILWSSVLLPSKSRRNAVLDRISSGSKFIRIRESRMVRRWSPPQVRIQTGCWSGTMGLRLHITIQIMHIREVVSKNYSPRGNSIKVWNTRGWKPSVLWIFIKLPRVDNYTNDRSPNVH